MSTTASLAATNPNFVGLATICCILPREDGQPFTMINRTHGVYCIWHPKIGEPYALTQISWKRDYADIGDYDPAFTRRTNIERRKEFTFDAKQIADDVCKQINANGPGENSFFGVFVCADSIGPTESELTEARQRLESYFMQTIAAADSQWSANPRHDLISGIAKRGAKHLGIEREWLSLFRPTMDCPGCGSRLKVGVAVCKDCGVVVDRAKAEALGLVAKAATESAPPPEPALIPSVPTGKGKSK